MSKTRKYTILKPKTLTNQYGEKILVRFILNEKSKFPGVVIDINWFELKEDAESPNNSELRYSIVKLPKKRKYDNLDDAAKSDLENDIRDVFLEILTKSFKLDKALKEKESSTATKSESV